MIFVFLFLADFTLYKGSKFIYFTRTDSDAFLFHGSYSIVCVCVYIYVCVCVCIYIYSGCINLHSHQQCKRVGSLFSNPSPAFVVCRLFGDGHSDQCEVIPGCGSDLHFSNNDWCWASFRVFVGHLYVFFGEMSAYAIHPLFDWVVCFSGIELQGLLVYFGD